MKITNNVMRFFYVGRHLEYNFDDKQVLSTNATVYNEQIV